MNAKPVDRQTDRQTANYVAEVEWKGKEEEKSWFV
jgi:hypothetical protein